MKILSYDKTKFKKLLFFAIAWNYISVGKESACNAGDPGSILGQEDPLEKG